MAGQSFPVAGGSRIADRGTSNWRLRVVRGYDLGKWPVRFSRRGTGRKRWSVRENGGWGMTNVEARMTNESGGDVRGNEMGSFFDLTCCRVFMVLRDKPTLPTVLPPLGKSNLNKNSKPRNCADIRFCRCCSAVAGPRVFSTIVCVVGARRERTVRAGGNRLRSNVNGFVVRCRGPCGDERERWNEKAPECEMECIYEIRSITLAGTNASEKMGAGGKNSAQRRTLAECPGAERGNELAALRAGTNQISAGTKRLF
jgi:hypothetical protein